MLRGRRSSHDDTNLITAGIAIILRPLQLVITICFWSTACISYEGGNAHIRFLISEANIEIAIAESIFTVPLD